MKELEERRQRAREAYHDAPGGHATYPETRLDLAIETATRVKITREVWEVLYQTYDQHDPHSKALEEAFTAAVRALGFEVEE